MIMCGFGSTTDLGKQTSIFHVKTIAQKYIQALQKLWVLAQGVQKNWFCNFLIFSTILYEFCKPLDLVETKPRLRSLHTGPSFTYMPLAFTTVPLRRWASSPAARWDRRTQTKGCDHRLDSRGVDPCRWLGQRKARRWTAARQPRRLRGGEGSGEMWGGARPCVAVESSSGV
jgi:hypothetical protein